MIEFEVDLSEVGGALGAIQGTADAFYTRTYVRDIVTSAQHQMGREFNNWMNAQAGASPKRYHHVYEWNHVGQAGFRLWKNVYTVSSSKSAVTSFIFLPSKTQVPLPEYEPSATGKQLHRRHIFWNKARVMEYNIPVHIFPKGAKKLFIDLGDHFIFRDSATVFNPGGSATNGAFTAAFVSFYREIAPRIYAEKIKPRLEASTEGVVTESGRVAARSRVGANYGWKSFELSYNAGRELARSEMEIEAARYADSGYDEAFAGAFE